MAGSNFSFKILNFFSIIVKYQDEKKDHFARKKTGKRNERIKPIKEMNIV